MKSSSLWSSIGVDAINLQTQARIDASRIVYGVLSCRHHESYHLFDTLQIYYLSEARGKFLTRNSKISYLLRRRSQLAITTSISSPTGHMDDVSLRQGQWSFTAYCVTRQKVQLPTQLKIRDATRLCPWFPSARRFCSLFDSAHISLGHCQLANGLKRTFPSPTFAFAMQWKNKGIL